MCADMGRVGSDLLGRGDVRAVLLTANGKFFTVGGDIRMFADQLDTLPTQILEWTSTLHMGLARLKRLNAPLIASVHGVCMGGGVALVGCLRCRLRQQERTLWCGVIRRSAIPATRVLRSRWPRGWASPALAASCCSMKCSLRTRRCPAGLADFVVDDAALADTAEQAARQLAQGPTRAFGEIRRLIDKALRTPLESQLEDEAQALVGLRRPAPMPARASARSLKSERRISRDADPRARAGNSRAMRASSAIMR